MDTITSFLPYLLPICLGALAGAVAALRVIAPKTKNTTDDAVLARLEALEALLDKLTGGAEPKA